MECLSKEKKSAFIFSLGFETKSCTVGKTNNFPDMKKIA